MFGYKSVSRPSSSSGLHSISGQGQHRSKSVTPLEKKFRSSHENKEDPSSASLDQLIEHLHNGSMSLPLHSNISTSSEINAETAPHREDTPTQSNFKFHLNPGFCLVQDGEPRLPDRVEWETLLKLFPACTSVTVQPPFIIVCFETLPSKPWPVTLGGLALYYTTDPNAQPLPKGLRGRGPGLKIEAEIHRTRVPQHEAFIQIFAALDEQNMKITKLQWIAGRFYALAEAPKEEWQSKFPAKINGFLINYSFDEEAFMKGQFA